MSVPLLMFLMFIAGLELRHRQHARVEDRIRQAKATGLRNLPCHSWSSNSAWLEIVLTATDLIAWCKLIGFSDEPDLARCEIATFRYRVLHVAARISRGARQIHLRIDRSCRWATAIAANRPGSCSMNVATATGSDLGCRGLGRKHE